MKKYTMSPGEFVARPCSPGEREALTRKLPKSAAVEPLPGDPGALLIHWPAEGETDAASLSQRLQRSLGAQVLVYPVLHDASGTPVYPTGRVAVRFRKPLSDAELERFGRKHGFELVRRNEFQPQQAVFEPQAPGTRFLPDVVDAASADADVTLAWPETKSQYRK